MDGSKNAGSKLSEKRKKEYLSGKAAVNDGVAKLNEAIKERNKSAPQKVGNDTQKRKSAVDKMWDRNSQPRQRTEEDEAVSAIAKARRNTEQKKKELEEYQNTEYDWTDAAARELYEKGQKQKEAEISKAQAEQNAAVANFDRAQIDRMPEEDKEQFRKYVESKDQKNSVFRNDISWFGDYKSQKEAENILKQKYGEEQFTILADAYAEKIHEEEAAKATEDARGATEKHPILQNILGAPARVLGSVDAIPTRIVDVLTGNKNPSVYTPNNYVENYGNAVRDSSVQMIEGEDPSAPRKALSDLYQGATSIADSALRGMVGGGSVGGALLAAGGTFDQTIADAVSRGATAGQAYSLATAYAIIEYAAEKLPLDNLIEVAKGGGAKTLVAKLAKQAGVEIAEEEATLAGDILLDAAIMQEKSEYNLSVAAYMASGMTEEQAREQAILDLLGKAGETAIISGFSGVLGGFGASAAAAFNRDGLDTAQQGAQQAQVAQNQQDVNVEGQQETTAHETQAKPQTPQEQERAALEAAGEELAKNAPKPEPAEPMTEGQRNLENAAAIVNGVQPEQKAAPAGDESGKTLNEKLYERDWYGVGKRNVKAYMYENPEVKPYFQAEAQNMLMELNDSTRGERFYNDDVYYETGGEKGISGVKRHTSDDIAYLLDSCGFTYDQIENGLKAIIEDNGAENNAASKRLEFILHDRLMNGYNDFYSNGRVPQSEDYVDLVTQKGVTEYDSAPPVDTPKASARGAQGENDASVPENGQEVPKTEQGQEIPEGMKGTGAAEQNFSGKAAYQDLLTDENAQRDRSTGVRPVEVPKVDANGKRVTEFAGNVYSAKVTPDSTANAVESLIQDGKLGFDTRTNQQSLENARQAILDNGPDAILREIASNAENNVIRDGDVEKAMVLYAAYANDPEMQDEASGLIADMGKIANMSGRNLQLFSLMQRMTPEGQIMAVRKNVSRYIDDINRTRKGRKKVTYEISHELENQYIYAKTDGEKQEALKAIYEDAASGIKPTLGEMWDAWRNLSMLGNALTHERNIGSTAAWQPFVEVKRDIGAAIEAVALRKKRYQRTKAILGFSENDRALLKWARADAKTQSTKKLMEGSGRTGNEAVNEIQKYRKLLPGPLDKLSKWNMELMEAEDSIFKRHEYSRSLASFLKARGYTAQQLQNGEVPVGVLDQARQHAVQEAKKATFNDQNEFSKQFSNMLGPKANNPAILNVIKKANTPYLRTPANIVHRAWENSPLSLGKTLITAKSDIDSGRMSASDVIDRVSSGLSGTAAMGLGAALSAGIIPGVRLIAEPTEEEEMEGAVPYSIQIGDKYYPAAWLAPAMINLFIGARLNENLSRNYEENGGINGWDVVQAVADSFAHALDPILDLSVLSSLKRVLEEVGSYGDFSDKVVSLVVGSATEYLAQGIPVLFGQLEKAFEPEKKSVYVNTDRSIEKTVKKTIGNATNRIPGIDLYQTTKLDDAGNPVSAEGDALARAMDAMFNPITISERSADPVIKEMARLNKTPDVDVKPKTVPKTVSYNDKNGNEHTDVRITEEQYQTWSSVKKKADYRITHDLVSGTDFKNLTDRQKAKALELAHEYANDQGKRAALDDYPNQSGWMAGIDGKEAVEIIKKVNADTLQSAMNDLTAAWANGWDDSGKKNALSESYDTLNKMGKSTRDSVIAESSSWTSAFLEVRDQGVSTKTFAGAVKRMDAQRVQEGFNAVRPAQKYTAIANAPGVDDKTIDKLMKAWMPDYDPNEKGSDSTEMKYDYIRQKMGYSPAEYAKSYDIYSFEKSVGGSGTANRTRKRMQEELGISAQEARLLYKLYGGQYKPWNEK